MRILHTADLHLGQILYQNYSRTDEHRHFFSQLEHWCETYTPDALVVSGDVFDIQQPGVHVKEFFNNFFVELHNKFPELTVVITAGNHDSPSRLHADRLLWNAQNVYVVALPPPFDIDNAPEGWQENFIIRLKNGYIVALPFLAGERPLQIQALLDYVNAENAEQKPVVMTGHTAVEGMDYTGHDFKGNVKTIKTDKLGTGYDYLALGHIHKPQTIGHEEDLNDEIVTYPAGVIRYSGSALHVSCDERYPHTVSLVDIDRHNGNVTIQQLRIEQLRHFHILPSDKESYHSLEETIDGVKAFIQNGGKGYFRLHIDYGAQIPSDINQTIYTLIENDDELRYNPRIIWKGEEEAKKSETAAPTFEIADLQQMTDPMHFIERTIDRYPQFTLEELAEAFREVEQEVRLMQEEAAAKKK